ncbi:MAG: hypothetical protein U5N53_09480 [Mycobacterium sp.]|nr:hypothetical protein [Mycobacterium sp.]
MTRMLVLPCCPTPRDPATAREKRSFDINVVLSADRLWLTSPRPSVVNAEGNEIRRGIYRDIPVVMLAAMAARYGPGLR